MNFVFTLTNLFLSLYLVAGSDHKMLSLLRTGTKHEVQSCRSWEYVQLGQCQRCPTGQVANEFKTGCKHCAAGTVRGVDGESQSGCVDITDPKFPCTEIWQYAEFGRCQTCTTGEVANEFKTGCTRYEAERVHFDASGVHRQDVSTTNGTLIGSLLGKALFCHENSKDLYKTKAVSKAWARWYKLFHRSDKNGSCDIHCSELCDHQACVSDYQLSSDRSTCTCIRNAGMTCDNNARCSNDKCQCLDGFEGDGQICCDISSGERFVDAGGGNATCKKTWSLQTENEYLYHMWNETLGGSGCVSFKVKASNDAHIGFFTSYQQTFRPLYSGTPGFYEIVIGGWADTRSTVRNGGQGDNQNDTYSVEGWLNGTVHASFWTCARNDTVSMGTGAMVGENTISCYHFSEVGRTIQYVGFSTGWGSTGDWIDITINDKFAPDRCA